MWFLDVSTCRTQRSAFAVHSVLVRGMSAEYLKGKIDTMRLCVIKTAFATNARDI